MMNKTAALAAALRVPAEFSLESVMGCGFGACWGCVKRTRKNGRDAWHKVCEEGPIFAREQIIWSGEEE
jgi:dihydroorotate dehydrogenase electron transfer subunit